MSFLRLILYILFAVLVKLKIKKKKVFRTVLTSESRKEDKDLENLLSPEEWLDMFRETCTGLLRIGSPACHYRVIYFIYCAIVSTKFTASKQLERVSPEKASLVAS